MSKKWGYLNYKLLTIAHTLLRLHQNPIEIKQKNTKWKKKHIAFFKSALGGNTLQETKEETRWFIGLDGNLK